MTPRKRAEALGWQRWARSGRYGWRVPGGQGLEIYWSFEPTTAPLYWHVAGHDYATEDEALAHAFLLRDVALS